MEHPFRWRLTYPMGQVFNELPGGSSIDTAWPGAVALDIVHFTETKAEPVQRIPIPMGRRPLWWRTRSLGMEGGGIRTDRILFGHGKREGVTQNVTLWRWDENGATDALAEDLDEAVVNRQLGGPDG